MDTTFENIVGRYMIRHGIVWGNHVLPLLFPKKTHFPLVRWIIYIDYVHSKYLSILCYLQVAFIYIGLLLYNTLAKKWLPNKTFWTQLDNDITESNMGDLLARGVEPLRRLEAPFQMSWWWCGFPERDKLCLCQLLRL